MSLSPTFYFLCVNHDIWPSFNCRRGKDSTTAINIFTANYKHLCFIHFRKSRDRKRVPFFTSSERSEFHSQTLSKKNPPGQRAGERAWLPWRLHTIDLFSYTCGAANTDTMRYTVSKFFLYRSDLCISTKTAYHSLITSGKSSLRGQLIVVLLKSPQILLVLS